MMRGFLTRKKIPILRYNLSMSKTGNMSNSDMIQFNYNNPKVLEVREELGDF